MPPQQLGNNPLATMSPQQYQQALQAQQQQFAQQQAMYQGQPGNTYGGANYASNIQGYPGGQGANPYGGGVQGQSFNPNSYMSPPSYSWTPYNAPIPQGQNPPYYSGAGGGQPNYFSPMQMPQYQNPFNTTGDWGSMVGLSNYMTPEQRDPREDYLKAIGVIAPLQLQAQNQASDQALAWNAADWTRRGDVFNQNMEAQKAGLEQAGFNRAGEQWQAKFGQDTWGMQQDFAIKQKQNQIDNMYKQGLITNAQYENETGRLTQASNAAYQQGQLGNQQFANQTDRQLGQGQLANTQFMNKATAAYQQGQLGNQGYANVTERQLGQGNLALGQSRLTQEGQIAREQMGSNELQSRYSAFGRAQAPSSQWNRGWS